MHSPKLSVVMPVFNGGRWLQAAIASIQNQSFKDFEFLIVDDGSTDGSDHVIAESAGRDDRIRFVPQPHAGLPATLNKGIALACGPWIARMDADDIAVPSRLERQFEYLVGHPGLGGLGTWAWVIDENGRRTGELKPATQPEKLRAMLGRQNPFIHSSMMMSAALAREVGGYRPPLDGAEDYDLWLRMSEKADLSNLPEFLLEYRRHSASASIASNRKQLLAARLSSMSAEARRNKRTDFVEQLPSPLSVGALRVQKPLEQFAAFYELLDRKSDQRFTSRELNALACPGLSHAERKAAQSWIKHVISTRQSWQVRCFAIWWMVYLHPPRAISILWSWLIRARDS